MFCMRIEILLSSGAEIVDTDFKNLVSDLVRPRCRYLDLNDAAIALIHSRELRSKFRSPAGYTVSFSVPRKGMSPDKEGVIVTMLPDEAMHGMA